MSQAATNLDESRLELLGTGVKFRDELYQMLESTPFFTEFSREDIETIAQGMNAYLAKKGTQIFKEGERNAGLCVLVKGKISILKYGGPYQSKKIAVVPAGRCIGEMSIVDGQPMSASAVAGEDSKILLMSRNNFLKMIDRYPTLGAKLLMKIASMISMRLRRTTGQLVDFLDAEIVNKAS